MKEILVPDEVYAYLEKIGEQERASVSDIVVKLVLNIMSQEEKVKALQAISKEYIIRGRELEEKGALVESGEMYWRGLAFLMQSIAIKLGFEITSYQDYFSLIDYLSYKLNDGEIVKLFVNSERLHGEYHPRPQGESEFKFRVDNLFKLMKKLEKIAEFSD
ncbi:MAG: PaREP1 family protein [Sulfolobaceae archaeon]|jgi:predicted CopG family antitoxin|nr:PaREP1 family protein [Sulfolobaceae archaeon]